MNSKGQIGLYIHWPFCLSKCPYCDFNVHVRDQIDHDRWQAAYIRCLETYAELTKGRVLASIFFGGGTPSTMKPEVVGSIIDKARSLWPCVNDLDVTLEANPTSIEADKFSAFKDAGVSRVSIGVQALNDADLAFLGRAHSAADALRAIEIASDTFDRFSFDLMYARPDQTLDNWCRELERAAMLARGHLSLYQLTIERNTPFHYDHAQGVFNIPNDGLATDFYNLTQDVLSAKGLPAYEVSNHAEDGHESRHNLIYWHYGDYIGIGPGAHGRLTLEGQGGVGQGGQGREVQKFATREHHAPDVWLEKVEAFGRGAHPFELLFHEDRFLEALMMGLRLNKGVCLDHLSEQGGKLWENYVDLQRLKVAQDEGWIKRSTHSLCLTPSGILRLNALIPYILK